MDNDPSAWTYVAAAVGLYAAALSTFLAVRQVFRDRRRLRITYDAPLAWTTGGEATGKPFFTFVCFGVRVSNERERPVQVESVYVVTEDGSHYHPVEIVPPDTKPPRRPMISDGDSADYYFDVLSFEDDGYIPKRIVVRSTSRREYDRRVSRRARTRLAEWIAKTRDRLGPDVQWQQQAYEEEVARSVPDEYR
jgi:hypothetical protein